MQKSPESHPRNDDTFRRACQLTAEGISRSNIAKTLDISTETLIRWTESEEWGELLSEFTASGTRNQPRDPEKFDQACKLWAAGKRKTQIAEAVNVTVGTITRWSRLTLWESKVNEYRKNTPKADRKNTPKAEVFQPRNRVAFDQACQLKAANFSNEEIAATVRVSVATIRRWSKWEAWESKVEAYKQTTRQRVDDMITVDLNNITLQFLKNLNLQEIKDFCIVLKRTLDISERQAAQEAEERELAGSDIIKELEKFCEGKNMTAIELRNQWINRI